MDAKNYKDKISRADLQEEECRLNLVKAIMDCACGIIISRALQESELERFQSFVKTSVMKFIPEQEELYDRIYASRLKRFIEQFPSDRDSLKSD